MDSMEIMDLPFTQGRHHAGRMHDSVRSGPRERPLHVLVVRNVDLDILVHGTLKRIDRVVGSNVSRIIESVQDAHGPLRMLLMQRSDDGRPDKPQASSHQDLDVFRNAVRHLNQLALRGSTLEVWLNNDSTHLMVPRSTSTICLLCVLSIRGCPEFGSQ